MLLCLIEGEVGSRRIHRACNANVQAASSCESVLRGTASFRRSHTELCLTITSTSRDMLPVQGSGQLPLGERRYSSTRDSHIVKSQGYTRVGYILQVYFIVLNYNQSYFDLRRFPNPLFFSRVV